MFVSVIKWCEIEFCRLAADIKTNKQMAFSGQKNSVNRIRVKEIKIIFSRCQMSTSEPMILWFVNFKMFLTLANHLSML